ncbi:MAG: chromosomal replication initiator protein DnaA [Clostridia bacterium]|nr:chromosomal replication initiator protein DnaA [Clostridia bacterium]
MNIERSELNARVKEELKKETSSITYKTWLEPLEIISITNNHIVFEVQSIFQKDMAEGRYRDLILNILQFITNMNCTFSVVCNTTSDEQMSEMPSILPEKIIAQEKVSDEDFDISYSKSSLNPKYTFDNFVVGSYNRFAHAASLAVGDTPYTAYNPLFIYGGAGLGKTHLLYAIGNRILENNRNAKVLYVTSEKFTNQFINALADAKIQAFRNKYREIDVLLIDDIQFIAGKERIQEEFFHTFNTLYENEKQIVLSSDQPPRSIKFLEDRLVGRFEWGLLADISPTDYETRLAILRKKTQAENIAIDDFILSDIATKIDSNIRELEGVYQKIVAHATLTQAPITIELAEKIINEFISKKEKKISSEYIQDTVAKYFNISKDDIASNKRSNDIAYPRQIAMYLCRDVANMPFKKIGQDFGGKDHSTVMHACKKIENDIREKDNTKLIVESVKNIIVNGE